ncbi:MAG TPA: hypothetical protein VG738_02965 [Chitinophagaceae bacterium]|nr:hypothetical protein [Chitinophagaceae bacterium]
MINLDNVLLLTQITFPLIVVVFVIAFTVGFLIKLQKASSSSKTLAKLQKEKNLNKDRITALNERLSILEKNSSGTAKGEQDEKK